MDSEFEFHAKKYKIDDFVTTFSDIDNNIKMVLNVVSIHKLYAKGNGNIITNYIKNKIVTLTPFISGCQKCDKQRVWHILNDVYAIPTCAQCKEQYVKFSSARNAYGVYCSKRCSGQSPRRSLNIKRTVTDRYGVDNISKLDATIEKLHTTNMKKYGVIHPSQLEEYKEKARNSNLAKYGAKCKTQSHISTATLDSLNDPNWLFNQNHILNKSLVEIADELGIYDTTLGTYYKKFNITVKLHDQSIAEKQIGELLSKHFNVELKNRTIISPYELDIYLPDLKIAIEYHGLYFHSEITAHKTRGVKKDLHKKKYELCRDKGIRLIQIFENEWCGNKDLVIEKILHITGKTNKNKIYARACVVEKINTNEKTAFFNQYHIQGNGPSSINYGLYHSGVLVAVMGLIKKQNSLMLNRFATSCGVIGGFSKLLKRVEVDYDYPEIHTFADLRWSSGDLYHNTGFILDYTIPPDYYWIKGKALWHKFNFRHSRMKTKLKTYDPSLSETKNMHNNQYYRIWDCGKLHFVKNKR